MYNLEGITRFLPLREMVSFKILQSLQKTGEDINDETFGTSRQFWKYLEYFEKSYETPFRLSGNIRRIFGDIHKLVKNIENCCDFSERVEITLLQMRNFPEIMWSALLVVGSIFAALQFASGLRSGREHRLLSRTAAGNRAYTGTGSSKKQIYLQHEACLDQITQGCNFREKPRELFRFFDQPMNNLKMHFNRLFE